MSVNAMTTRAERYARRTGTGVRPESLPGPQPQSGEAAQPGTVARATEMILTYIPTEIVTLYVAAVAMFSAPDQEPKGGQWLLMWVVLGLTPVITWTSYGIKLRRDGGPLPLSPAAWPWLDMTVASVAFFLWAFSLPNSPFETLDWYRPGLSAFALLLGTTLIPVLMQLLRPEPAAGGRPDAGATGDFTPA